MPGSVGVGAFEGVVDLSYEAVGVVSVAGFGDGYAVVVCIKGLADDGGEGVLGGYAGEYCVVGDNGAGLVLLEGDEAVCAVADDE